MPSSDDSDCGSWCGGGGEPRRTTRNVGVSVPPTDSEIGAVLVVSESEGVLDPTRTRSVHVVGRGVLGREPFVVRTFFVLAGFVSSITAFLLRSKKSAERKYLVLVGRWTSGFVPRTNLQKGTDSADRGTQARVLVLVGEWMRGGITGRTTVTARDLKEASCTSSRCEKYVRSFCSAVPYGLYVRTTVVL